MDKLETLIGEVILIVVALSLLGVVISSVAAASLSLTGASQTLVNLITTFYVIAVLLSTIRWAVGKAKGY